MRCLLLRKIYFLTLLFLSYLCMGVLNGVPVGTTAPTDVKSPGPAWENRAASQIVSEEVSQTRSKNRSQDSSKTPQPTISITQTPAAVTVMEGSALCMKCLFQINSTDNKPRTWYIEWFKNGTNTALTNSNKMSIITSKGFSHLILNKTEIADSGIYTCKLGVRRLDSFFSHGTWLTVDAITNLMVNQNPEFIKQKEGTNVTIECRFRPVSDYSSTEVRWYRNGTKLNGTGDSLRIRLDLERGFTSLTLTNAAVRDSGDYICRVESRSRNLTGSGNASRVAITTDLPPQSTEHTKHLGPSPAAIGAGAGAGVAILLLVVAGVILWKHRSKVSRSELETSPSKEIGLHPPLVSQASEVTYADLHFNKREVRPDAEVVYAEVRAPQKQQAGQDAKQMRPAGNQRR